MIPLFLLEGAPLACKCGESVTVQQTGKIPPGWIIERRETPRQLVTALEPTCPLCSWPYVWYWVKRLPNYKGQPCRMLVRTREMNSCLLEFQDGYKVVTSRNGIRKRRSLNA